MNRYIDNEVEDQEDDSVSTVSASSAADDMMSSASESSSASTVVESAGAERASKEHKRFQAYVVSMSLKGVLLNSHFVRVKSTSVKGAAAKAITRAAQSPRIYKNDKGPVRQNRLIPYPADIKKAVQNGRNVFVFIRGINKANKPLRPYAYVGSLVKQNPAPNGDDFVGNIGFKYKAKLFSLDMDRTKVVHELNKAASREGYRVRASDGKKIQCKKMTPQEIKEVYDEPRRALKQLAQIGNKALAEIVFPDYTSPNAACQIANGKIVRI